MILLHKSWAQSLSSKSSSNCGCGDTLYYENKDICTIFEANVLSTVGLNSSIFLFFFFCTTDQHIVPHRQHRILPVAWEYTLNFHCDPSAPGHRRRIQGAGRRVPCDTRTNKKNDIKSGSSFPCSFHFFFFFFRRDSVGGDSVFEPRLTRWIALHRLHRSIYAYVRPAVGPMTCMYYSSSSLWPGADHSNNCVCI